MIRSCILLVLVWISVGIGCARDEMLEPQVKEAADAAMEQWCASNKEHCDKLIFTELSRSSEALWLVEYQSSDYMFGVIVNNHGGVEITHASKE